jgi:hypothetical protein
MSNDLVHSICKNAVNRFGGYNGEFTAATFSAEIAEMSNTSGMMDGDIVEIILFGRDDVTKLGEKFYKLKYDY